MKGLINWLDLRLGIVRFYHEQLAFEMPEGINYWYLFSGLTIGCIALQILSGFYMLWYFVPEPTLAHASVRKMCMLSSTGALMRNLHRWSATFGLLFVFLHACHVMVRRAYRSPRELNWWTGMFLGIIFTAFLITGVILPWDWRSYWELIIWADWVKLIPVVGPYIQDLVIGQFSQGRNFAVHIIFLPALILVVLAIHIALERRLGMSERV